MKGIFYILAAYLSGELLSKLIGGFLPASVLGMLVMFAALKTELIKEDDIKQVSEMLLNNLVLFFVPIAVGLMVSGSIIGNNLVAIVITLLVTTILVIAVVGWMQQTTGAGKDGK